MENFINALEEKRLNALREFNIIGIDVDFSFILESISAICEVPLCNIVVVSEEYLVVIASTGVKITKQHKREGSCIQYTLDMNKFCEIKDIRKQDGIDYKKHLIEDYEIQFFAGSPLKDTQGNTLGTLNIYDYKPRVLTNKQKYFIAKASKRIVELFIQKRKEQRLLFFDSMFNSSKDIFGIIRFNGKILKVNPAFSELLGYGEDEILEESILKFLLPSSLDNAKASLKRLIGGKSEMNYRLPYVTKDNIIKWIEWTSTPELATELIYFIGRDITEENKQSLLLKNSEARFRAFFENSQILMSTHDMEGNFISINKSGADMLGCDVKEALKMNVKDLYPKEKHLILKAYFAEMKISNIISGVTEIITKHDEKRVWLINSIVQKNPECEPYVMTNAMDLTDRYKMERNLKEASRNAQAANQAKSEFIANMSHEIRTPLNGIIGFTDLVLKTPLDETQQQYLKIINQSGITLLKIVNQILDFSKIESRQIILYEEKIDLQNLASEACAMVSYGLEKKRLEMLLDIKEDLPRYIWADEIRLKQVLVNLLSNAVKFTEKGEIKLSISIKEKLDDNKMIFHFEVSDTGIGINPDKMEQIFKVFAQEDSSINKKYGGTGLGLAISNRLLEFKNSKLELKSELGKGSHFSFDLKLKIEYDRFDDKLIEGINNILVVDDNVNSRIILKRMLEIKKITVDEADSGLTAIQMMKKKSDYDIIIMDYHMPIMNGVETVKKLKGLPNISKLNQPVIMLCSTSDDEKLQNACDDLNIESRLVKPIKMQEMYETLAKLKSNNLKKSTTKQSVNISDQKQSIKCTKAFAFLIVEDNEINRYLTKVLVNEICPNSKIYEAIDGVEAVDLFFTKLPDIVLMDIQMPNMNGIDATLEIRTRALGKSVPIIALTAGSMTGEKESCLDAGMNDFIIKPIVKNDLVDMIDKWLEPIGEISQQDYNENVNKQYLNKPYSTQYPTNNLEFRNKFIERARKTIQESVKELQIVIQEKDLNSIKAISHKIKGLSLAIGQTQLSKFAVAFELLEELDDAYVNDLFETLMFEALLVDNLLNKDGNG